MVDTFSKFISFRFHRAWHISKHDWFLLRGINSSQEIKAQSVLLHFSDSDDDDDDAIGGWKKKAEEKKKEMERKLMEANERCVYIYIEDNQLVVFYMKNISQGCVVRR